MNISENICKQYSCYNDFVKDFIFDAIKNKSVFLIVNWADAEGLCSFLNKYTINNNSICFKSEYVDEMKSDIEDVKTYNGNMIITLFGSGEMICEKALDNELAYVDDGVYYIEHSATNITLPLHANAIPFKINTYKI